MEVDINGGPGVGKNLQAGCHLATEFQGGHPTYPYLQGRGALSLEKGLGLSGLFRPGGTPQPGTCLGRSGGKYVNTRIVFGISEFIGHCTVCVQGHIPNQQNKML